MMDKIFEVKFRNNAPIKFTEGTTFKEISETFKEYYKFDIIAASVDDNITDLSETLKSNCTVEFFDRTSAIGNSIYARSARYIMILAVKNVLGLDARFVIEHSVDNGIFCSIRNQKITKSTVDKIFLEMTKIVENDYNFIKLNVSRLDAMKYFKTIGWNDKVDLFKYISNTYVTLYRLNDMYDFFYGKLAYSTNQINLFKLSFIGENGFVLSIPSVYAPKEVKEYEQHKNIFEVFSEYTKWSNSAYIHIAADLNKVVSKAKSIELINISEAHYNSQLFKISEEIYKNKNKIRLILIAGPSSSGKTTTAKKLDIYLKSKGFFTHSIELDNYFIDINKRVLNVDGKPDLESIKALDLKLFNDNINDLLSGKEVNLPKYNFITGKREYYDNYLKLSDRDILIVEGIHALNPELTKSIDDLVKYRIFISPLTSINIDDHNYVHTTDIRKLRRIIRDSKTRGLGAKETLGMWSSIQKGEIENIFKFQDNVDVVINSALIYEIGILKTYVEPLLFNVEEDDKEYPEAIRLINLLKNFLPIPADEVPDDSVLREFIGGSCFKE